MVSSVGNIYYSYICIIYYFVYIIIMYNYICIYYVCTNIYYNVNIYNCFFIRKGEKTYECIHVSVKEEKDYLGRYTSNS